MSKNQTETCEGCGQEINPWMDHYCKGRAEAAAMKIPFCKFSDGETRLHLNEEQLQAVWRALELAHEDFRSWFNYYLAHAFRQIVEAKPEPSIFDDLLSGDERVNGCRIVNGVIVSQFDQGAQAEGRR